jgi:DNA invertase Pin-like site-specific DNA recombinase
VGEQAGIWLRVSDSGQDEKNQLPEVTAWCEKHGYDVAVQYVVHGKSAHKGNKAFDKAWAKVIKDMLTKKITVLVVWKLDRMDRKLQTFQMLAEVIEAGGRVEFSSQPQLNDLTTMGSRINLKIQEEMAYEESKIKSDRIKIANVTIRTNGGNPGRAPWGYKSVGQKYSKTLEPTEDGRRLVPEIFERVAKGDSLQKVADWLAVETDRTWWPRRLAWMIRNPTYRGHRIDANGVTVHICEALVDAALWARANKTLTAKPGKRGPISGESAMLTSVLFCGPCHERGDESPMYRIRPRPGTDYAYYRCAGAGAGRKGCGLMVRLAETDAEVVKWLSLMGKPLPVPRLVKGETHEIALAEVLGELAELPARAARDSLTDSQEDAERQTLRARRDQLEGLPSVPDRMETATLCDTCGGGRIYGDDCRAAGHCELSIGQHFLGLDDAGRREMMLDMMESDGFKVYANAPVEMVPGEPPVNSMPVSLVFADDEALTDA